MAGVWPILNHSTLHESVTGLLQMVVVEEHKCVSSVQPLLNKLSKIVSRECQSTDDHL